LGLTPKEDSTGPRRRLGAISKQGDVYLRMLMTHGARSLWSAIMPSGANSGGFIAARCASAVPVL
jgi:transposase